jgi:PAP2 superfamily
MFLDRLALGNQQRLNRKYTARVLGPRAVGSASDDRQVRTATAYFAIGAIVYLQRKILGLFAFFWIFLTVGLGRVVLGLHYPSDIVAGFFLGFSLVFLFTNLTAAQVFLMRVIQRYDARNCIYMTD